MFCLFLRSLAAVLLPSIFVDALNFFCACLQAVATRRLLQSTSDTAAVVQVQMTGSTEISTAQIAQELGSIVSNNALQVWLAASSLTSKLHG